MQDLLAQERERCAQRILEGTDPKLWTRPFTPDFVRYNAATEIRLLT